MNRYDPQTIEPKWQEIWRRERAFNVPNPGEAGAPESAAKTYVLEMLPYPSGELHMGHVRNYMLGEIVAHFRRRTGSRCCARWASTPSACRRRTPRSARAAIRAT